VTKGGSPSRVPFRPSRALGQSFLISDRVADTLVAALDIRSDDTVLEIGPGRGILTGRLVDQARRVVAVEIDRRLVEFLRRRFALNANLEIVHDDFLRYDFSKLGPVKVAGNLPYSVSSQMLFRLLDCLESWTRAVLTCQREFANRVLGQAGTKAYGALSVFFERACRREKLISIPPSSFRPKPRVVSTALRLQRRAEPLFPVEDEELFRKVVKACFSQRRKTLVNNLAHGLSLVKPVAGRLLEMAEISPGVRAEMLRPLEFYRLYLAFGRLASSSR